MLYSFTVLNVEFLHKLDQLLDAFPMLLSCESWGRSEKRNKAIGGAPSSSHLSWRAVDLTADDSAILVHAARKAQEIGFSGVELDLSNHHLHVDGHPRIKPWHVVRYSDKSEKPLSEYTVNV